MKNYTLAFLFNNSLDKVLLIHKVSPDWQKGKVNGIGGKIEEGETPLLCIMRELSEETTITLSEERLICLGKMINANRTEVYLFYSILLRDEEKITSKTAEEVEWFEIDGLPNNIMSNLSWLIPLCIDAIKNREIQQIIVENK